jgi:hypothetical protein
MRLIATTLLLSLGANAAWADSGAATTETNAGVGFVLKSVFAPRLRRGTTRVYGTVRPFFSVLGQGGGAIADLGVDHYFADWPLRLSLEIAPLALAIEADGPGSVGHVRVGGAFATDYIELGGSVGSRVQNYGGSGISLAASLRLGAVDGLRFSITYGYVVKRNQYTGDVVLGISSTLLGLQVPVGATLALFGESGISADKWIYASLGLRHRLIGDGGAGTWIISGSFGVAWVIDRPDCPYPDTGWCTDSAWAAGPTLGLGVEHRF